jgi:phage gp16-like protein
MLKLFARFMKSKKNATEKTKAVAEESHTQAEPSSLFAKECKKFHKRWEQMSEVERNRIAGEENPRTPEEEKYIHEEAIRTVERLDKCNAYISMEKKP